MLRPLNLQLSFRNRLNKNKHPIIDFKRYAATKKGYNKKTHHNFMTWKVNHEFREGMKLMSKRSFSEERKTKDKFHSVAEYLLS